MIWQEETFTRSAKHGDKSFLRENLEGLSIQLQDFKFVIPISGTYSLKRRKIIRIEQTTEVYKITIKNPDQQFRFLGVDVSDNIVNIFPIFSYSGPLFKKISKKFALNIKQNSIEFSINSKGQVF
jgi:hypothetical protein